MLMLDELLKGRRACLPRRQAWHEWGVDLLKPPEMLSAVSWSEACPRP